tara:strand:- start:68 stop:550 length:483 start_codon:yes stop_codon:yes gene_type:complete
MKINQMLHEVKKDTAIKYEPQLLSTKEQIDKYWDKCVPLLQKCIDRMDGELLVEDIYAQAMAGKAFIIIVKNDYEDHVKLALVLELVYYPRYTAMNVLALGGEDLKNMIHMFWKHVCSWAMINGVRKMECTVSPAMERILKSVGFKQQYIKMRQDLWAEA